MTTVDLTILTDSDESFVLSILNAMAEKKLIRFTSQSASVTRPGPALSVTQLNMLVEQSEQSGRVSVETAKTRLGL